MFNCVPTIEAICMLVTIHLRSASQQCLVVVLTTLPTIESHMVPYKYTRKAFQQFPCTLAGDSPKWNILVVTWALVICLKYTHLHSGCALVLVCIFQANHSCPCYNYYIYNTYVSGSSKIKVLLQYFKNLLFLNTII